MAFIFKKIQYFRNVEVSFFYDSNREKSVEAVNLFLTYFDKAKKLNSFDQLTSLKNQTLFVFGGDGTFHKVVNCIDFSNRLVLVPSGSGNDFVRNFQALAPCELPDALEKNKMHRIGLIKLNDIYGLNAAGFFYDAMVAKTANESNKKWGSMVYTLAALKHIFTYCTHRVLLNDVPRKLLMLSFGNGEYAGGGFKLFPGTKPTEFSFMRLQIGSIHILKRLAYLILVMFGKHHSLANVDLSVTTQTNVRSETKLMAEVDGEIYQFGNQVNVSYEPDCLSILVASPKD